MLYWKYQNSEVESWGAIAPRKLDLPYGKQDKNSPFISKDYATIWRAIENGYVTRPGDCPPIRLIAQYGYTVFCPGNIRIRRLKEPSKFREFGEHSAKFGFAEITGDYWPKSDSGLIASWIAGSEFVKMQTGIDILFPKTVHLYQGPLPNLSLINKPDHEVMSGMEFYSAKRTMQIHGNDYGIANMNVILKLPEVGTSIEFARGEPIGWFYPVIRSFPLENLGKLPGI